MTRVILSPDVLEYRQAMAELVDEALEHNTIKGVDARDRSEEGFPVRRDLPAFYMAGLLQPPQIEEMDIDIDLVDGRLDGCVLITASGNYSVMNVYVVLEDDHGNEIESDFATRTEEWEDYWGYVPSAALPPGTSMTVRAIAMDPLGGVAIQQEIITL